MKSLRRVAASLILVGLVSACALPRGAAMQGEILRNADSETPQFAHYQVDAKLLGDMAHWPQGKNGAIKRDWIKGGVGGLDQVIAAGDILRVGVWENGENKLLSMPGAPATELRPARVSGKGTIFIPYTGEVKVSGLTPEGAREKLQKQISSLIPDVQVQLEAEPGNGNAVSIVDGVTKPGKIPLVDRSMTVLDLIAEGGGVRSAIENPQLRLQRGGKVYQISMSRVLADPALNTGLRPGDKLSVEDDKRYFLALGAAGREQVVPFPDDEVNALEAVTLVGGLDNSRANPKGVLILRQYPLAAVHPDGKGGPSQSRVVFTINLTTTDGLFSAQNFAIEPEDLVLATESPVMNVRTILSLLNVTASTAYNVDRINP